MAKKHITQTQMALDTQKGEAMQYSASLTVDDSIIPAPAELQQ